jgi:hypothetical protein
MRPGDSASLRRLFAPSAIWQGVLSVIEIYQQLRSNPTCLNYCSARQHSSPPSTHGDKDGYESPVGEDGDIG